MKQVKINGLWWDCENTKVNGEKFADFDTANTYAKKISRRLPTKEELQALIDSGYEWDKEKQGMWFADRKLFLPAEGFKGGPSGSVFPDMGFYWSSSEYNDSFAYYLFFNDSIITSHNKGLNASSVRCVADRKDTWLTKIKRWFINL